MNKELFTFYLLLILGILCFITFIFVPNSNADVIIDMSIIAQIESGNNPRAISFLGEEYGRGLYQISEIVLKEYNKFNNTNYDGYRLFDTNINTKIANWYMNKRIPQMLRYYKLEDSIDNRLWAWNAGIKRVIDGVMPRETLTFIVKYLELRKDWI